MENRRSFLTRATLGLAAAGVSSAPAGTAGLAETVAAPQENPAGERYELSNEEVGVALDEFEVASGLDPGQLARVTASCRGDVAVREIR